MTNGDKNRQQSLSKTIDVCGVGAINGANYVTASKLMHTSNVTSADAVSQSPGSKKTSKVAPEADVILSAPAARQIFATGGSGVQRRYRPTFANVKLKSHQ